MQNFKTSKAKGIITRSHFSLLLMLSLASCTSQRQVLQTHELNIGDPAPKLHIKKWVKGKPVQKFEKGKIYVVEFWASWCKPCIAYMPHLSAIANKYQQEIKVLGINIYEEKKTSAKHIKAFVDSMGQRMDYLVATQDSMMTTKWMGARGEQGIPKCFVIDRNGNLAWIGHPRDIEDALQKIVTNTWDVQEALTESNWNKYLNKLDKEVYYEVLPYMDDILKPGDLGQPDSILSVVRKIIAKEPKLTYAPVIAYHTFSSLLKTNPDMAYEYGKNVLATTTYDEPDCYSIIEPIHLYSESLKLPLKIYQLGAEAYQLRIKQLIHPELVNMPNIYDKMAGFYCRASDKKNAIDAQQKAIKELQSRGNSTTTDIAAFESRLEKYIRMELP